MSTEMNTASHSYHRFHNRKETQTQQTKHSVTRVFCYNLDLNTAGEKPERDRF